MAKNTPVDPHAILKFESAAYTASGISQMNDVHLLELHNKLAKFLGNEERISYPSRKLLESKTLNQLRLCQHPDTKKAPDSVKATPTKGEKKSAAKSDIPSDSGKPESKETTMGKVATKKTAAKATKGKATKSTERRKTGDARSTHGQFAGKKLRAATKENPRREGTHGFNSMKIILANPGITYEDYLAKGGR